MITRQEIISSVSIRGVMEQRGHQFVKRGKELFCVCPFHKDSSPSFRLDESKHLWFCDPCGFGGSVIDLISKIENVTIAEIFKRYEKEEYQMQEIKTEEKPKAIKVYSYNNEIGELCFQVIRYEPKTFRQRHSDSKGGWIWNMDGVERVLYRLPEVLASQIVWIVEGEKDVDNLFDCGFVATCNVGGAGKWLPAYTESLKGKHIIVCPDNDDPGIAHSKLVMDSLAGKIECLQYLRVPSPFKDISDFLNSIPKEERKERLLQLLIKTPKLKKGVDLPILDFGELEKEFSSFAINSEGNSLSLGHWIPSFKKALRDVVPGEVLTFLADTSTGKTAILQNLAIHARPLNVLFFQMELPANLMFERFMQIHKKTTGESILSNYKTGNKMQWDRSSMNHIFTCPSSRMTVESLQDLIIKSELKIGSRPQVVIVDYIGLMKASGKSRYEKMSDTAEELKRIAKDTNTIMILACQVHRKEGESNTTEITLHDAKDSGSIENSSGVVIGAWRSPSDPEKTLIMRVLKATRSRKNFTVQCNFHGETMTITERYDNFKS